MKRKFRIPVGELYKFFGLLDIEPEIPVELNRYVGLKNQYNQYNKINFLVKKRGMVNTYELEDDISIKCDERHLIRSNGNYVRINETTEVDTIYGTKKITNIIPDVVKDVYDFSLDSPHEYITSTGVMCHNTTLAKLLVNTIQCDHIIINASDENNVDMVRNKVKGFASTMGFNDLKVIILDECLDETTLVSVLRNGDEIKVPIKDLDEHNDLVKSWNVDKQQVQWRPFYHWDKGTQDVYEIELENGEVVVCTEDHKWYVEDINGNPLVVKAMDLHKYEYILSPQ